jgi:L-alanine-DL-glutamate epimerase-like enolase superfamily enzyme
MRIADYAAQCGVMVANHNFTTDLNTAASLHFLASIPNAFILEYCVEPSEISRNLAKEPFRMLDGYMTVPVGPGLGFEPDAKTIEKFLVHQI